MIHVYVAGPITKGDQFANVRNAILVADRLRRAGLAPFVPHLFAFAHTVAPAGYEDWMALDMAWLARCDALLRLPGESAGADREVAEAQRLGLMVVDARECVAWDSSILGEDVVLQAATDHAVWKVATWAQKVERNEAMGRRS